ncbi:MAG: ABC transporter ATP-binding protein [Lachnospiraceae bacterium]|nr:ABC transporter ATP-binding protein [Lachnospiraceae bacterium]
MDTILELKNISKSYRTKAAIQTVLKNINLKIEKEDMLAVMGRSGSGKSTLLKITGTMLKPDSGCVKILGKDTSMMSADEISKIRRDKIGFVFQDFRLMENMTAGENMLLPLVLDRHYSKEMQIRMSEVAEQLEIETILNKNIMEISGGEKQRVAIGRALINDPDIILADEPTGNLDSKSCSIIMQLLAKINCELGKTIIIVTHDHYVAGQCKKIIELKDGEWQ